MLYKDIACEQCHFISEQYIRNTSNHTCADLKNKQTRSAAGDYGTVRRPAVDSYARSDF
jgi:hypothetical protein